MNNNLADMIPKLMEFRRSFNGDPKQVFQQMVSSGKISQAQLNQVQAMASQLQAMLTK